jgi:carbamoyl-phosphate synthase large subunit
MRVVGLMNVQYAIKREDGRQVLYVLEVNPRASRTVPFVAKATGLPVAGVAAKVMAGISLAQQGVDSEPVPAQVSVKESVFPFVKFAGVDIVLGPEMRSTGEVMGVSETFPIAFAKSQLAAGVVLPRDGSIFISVASVAQKEHMVGLAQRLVAMGYTLLATVNTAAKFAEAGIPVEPVKKLQEGHPNLLDHLKNGTVRLIMNTPSGKGARTDEGRIRAAAVQHGIPCITTIPAADACVRAMEALREGDITLQAIQDRLSRGAEQRQSIEARR